MNRFLPFILMIQLILFSKALNAGHLQVSGMVSGTWNMDTVKVTGNLLVPAETRLLINPGVVILFSGHYQIDVKGSVVATGTMDALIKFSMNDTTGFSDTTTTEGGWHGFLFDNPDASSDSSKFTWCVFEYGKAVSNTDTAGRYGGAFRIFGFNKVHFENCTFRNNLAYHWGGAMFMKRADITIDECAFIGNHCGLPGWPYGYGGAICFVSSNPVVTSNYFESNLSSGVGGGASFEYSDAKIEFNTFYKNTSGLGGALCYLRSDPVKVVSNNLINQNEAIFFGGGIACLRAHTIFVNNTVVNNVSSYGGGFYANDSACPRNYNTIFYGNNAFTGTEVYIWDVYSAPDFYYCNVPGGPSGFAGSGGNEGYIGHYENNMDTVPMFTGSGDHPFGLSKESPFVDNGMESTDSLQVPAKDIAGNPRIYNNRIDIGAYEWNPGESIGSISNPTSLSAFPNPCKEMTTIEFKLPKPGILSIMIVDQKGTAVRSFYDLEFPSGRCHLDWDLKTDAGSLVASGLYAILISGKDIYNSINLVVLPQ